MKLSIMTSDKQTTLHKREGMFTIAIRGTEFEKLTVIKQKTGKSYADIIAEKFEAEA